MLSAEHRLRRSQHFTSTVRAGRRAGGRLIVVHYLAHAAASGAPAPATPPARAGLIVGRAVGGSVVRHRTARRLRHLLRERITRLAPGSWLVVRALPAAGHSTSAELAADLDAALQRVLRQRPAAGVAASGVLVR